jgi:hypothetical protein
MGSKKIVLNMGIIWAAASLLIGCALVQKPIEPNYKPDQYSTEIARLEAVIVQNPESSEGKQAHYQLAQLYVSYKNPRRDYKKSLENLNQYLYHHPGSEDDYNLQNWLSILTEIETQFPKVESQKKKIKQLTAKLESSRQENLALKEANSELEKTNLELTSKIEILKTLDDRVEEKRRNYKNE